MNEPYEPSYYEIALTGRQVLAAFVILLVCLVAAFFSGVWIGREGGESEPDRAQPVQAEEPESRPEELSFFDEEPMKRPRPLDEVAREARPGTTLREDVGGPGGAEEPRGEPPGDRAEPGAEPPPPTDGEPRRDPTPSGALATGDLVVQVLVSSEEGKAREILDRLQDNGFRAFLSPVADGGRTLYRVRVGPFEQRARAEEVAERLRKPPFNLETWITQ